MLPRFELDRRVFGQVPSVWLQTRLVDGPAHWYDAVAALVYVTHFVLIPVITGVVCTRLMFDWAVRARRIKKLYLG